VQGSSRAAIAASVAIVIAIILALTWIAIAEESHLPKIVPINGESYANLQHVGSLLIIFGAATLLLLWFRRRSVLDLWLLVAMCAWVAQGIAKWINTAGRASLSFYVGSTLFVVSSIVLLVVLLRETMTLYGRLAVSLVALRRLSAEKLLRSEAYLAEAQRLSHTGSFGWNVSSGEIYWSDETYRIFELDRSVTPKLELLFERIHPDDRHHMQQAIDRATNEGTGFDIEHRLLRPDGSVKYLRVLAQALEQASGEMEFVGAVTDVTAAKQAEDKIRQSETELRQLIDAIPQQVFVFSPDWSPLFANQQERDYTGLSSEKARSKDAVARVFHPEDLEKLEALRERGRLEAAPFELEARIKGKGGQYRWFLIRDNPLLDDQGRIVRWYSTRTDITDRKQAENKIRQSEMELRQILDFTPQHVAVTGPDRSRLYLNQAAIDYFGFTLEKWLSDDPPNIHPDDLERVENQIQGIFLNGLPHELELRMLRKDGTYRWFLYRWSPIRDEHGRITRWFIAGTDIENRKQTEQRLQNENVALREEIDRASMFEEIVGTSAALRAVLSRVSKVAPTDSTVLITGETGTGKELIARAIHKRSQRSSRPFVSVNCAAIPRDLIASELFGHEKGAFTGAIQRRLGRFELAEGGTIFLDEIGELPAETQISLLRVLQEREFERIGGTVSIGTNVRVHPCHSDCERTIVLEELTDDLAFNVGCATDQCTPWAVWPGCDVSRLHRQEVPWAADEPCGSQ